MKIQQFFLCVSVFIFVFTVRQISGAAASVASSTAAQQKTDKAAATISAAMASSSSSAAAAAHAPIEGTLYIRYNPASLIDSSKIHAGLIQQYFNIKVGWLENDKEDLVCIGVTGNGSKDWFENGCPGLGDASTLQFPGSLPPRLLAGKKEGDAIDLTIQGKPVKLICSQERARQVVQEPNYWVTNGKLEDIMPGVLSRPNVTTQMGNPVPLVAPATTATIPVSHAPTPAPAPTPTSAVVASPNK